jgi:uridine phosphorylase
MKKAQPNIQISRTNIPKYFLLPGDPARATKIAKEYLQVSKLLSAYREFLVYSGTYKNISIGVCSTGIGSPSTAMAVEELINLGAKVLIRVGTCGGALKKEISPGSIIIPLAAIREEGTTKEYLPPEFPAIADRYVVQALERAAKLNKYRYFIGINRTHDGYYGQAINIKNWGSVYLDPRMKDWPYPLLSSEMECAPIFLISLLRGVKAGAVLAVNSYPEDLRDIVLGKQKFAAPNSKIITREANASVNRAIKTALDAIALLEKI